MKYLISQPLEKLKEFVPNTINFPVKYEVKSYNEMQLEFKDCKKYSGGETKVLKDIQSRKEKSSLRLQNFKSVVVKYTMLPTVLHRNSATTVTD